MSHCQFDCLFLRVSEDDITECRGRCVIHMEDDMFCSGNCIYSPPDKVFSGGSQYLKSLLRIEDREKDKDRTWIQTSSGTSPFLIRPLTKLKSVSLAAGYATSICFTPVFTNIRKKVVFCSMVIGLARA